MRRRNSLHTRTCLFRLDSQIQNLLEIVLLYTVTLSRIKTLSSYYQCIQLQEDLEARGPLLLACMPTPLHKSVHYNPHSVLLYECLLSLQAVLVLKKLSLLIYVFLSSSSKLTYSAFIILGFFFSSRLRSRKTTALLNCL